MDYKKMLTSLTAQYGDQQVADAIGVHTRSLYNYKSGESNPRARTQKLINESFRKLQEGAEFLPKAGNAIADDSDGFRERYIELLEQTLKERREAARGLELHLNVTEEKQKAFLDKLEQLVLELCEVLTPVTEASEVEVLKGHKSAVKKRTS